MEISLINPERIINDMVVWKLPFPVRIQDFPRHTFAAIDDSILIAVGGLRLCEGPFCLLDTMATNPESPAEKRHEAINAIVDLILSTGKKLGFEGIIARSKESSIINRALSIGFVVVPEISFARSL